MIWVLILSELAVFGAGMVAFLAVRRGDASGFALAQGHLHRVGAGVNTVVLVTSGYFAARAASGSFWRNLAPAIALGAVFLAIKASEYADLIGQGIGTESHAFFTFSYLLTGFHAAHVLAGMVFLALAGVLQSRPAVIAAAAFWHMVDLVWVLLFPVVYLL